MTSRLFALTAIIILFLGRLQAAPGEEATTSTVRLTDLFVLPESSPGEVESKKGGAVLGRPDTLSAWRAPTPTPVLQATPVPPPLPFDLEGRSFIVPSWRKPPSAVDQIDRAGFEFRGAALNPPEYSLAKVTLETPYRRLVTEYRIVPAGDENESGRKELVILHAPETIESFWIPAGRWRLERVVWLPNEEGRIAERYDAQVFRPSGQYLFRTSPTDERQAVQRLKGP